LPSTRSSPVRRPSSASDFKWSTSSGSSQQQRRSSVGGVGPVTSTSHGNSSSTAISSSRGTGSSRWDS
jgi:hypothetical protein